MKTATNRVAKASCKSWQILADDISFPILPKFKPAEHVYDALRAAARRRKGIVVVAPQGTGKSMGLEEARERFAEIELSRRDKYPEYRLRSVAVLRTIRETSLTKIVTVIHAGIFALEMATTSRGKLKPYTQLVSELAALLIEQGIAVLVVDEAESLSPEALTVLRDIMSVSESMAPGRITSEDGKRRQRPGGVGVLLLGTEALRQMILTSPEAKQRWVRIDSIALIPSEAVPEIYQAMHPVCEAQARAMGAEAWARWVRRAVTPAQEAVTIRFIQAHLEDFHARLAATQRASFMEDLTFDGQTFLYSLGVARLTENPNKIDEDALDELRMTA